ncbi:MAG: GNAT family N-acetyltransferase [Lachnospiraceae bacterium]|nr:GNAT family N-acetyltransferase [Lachnospiraceae bacterium]
MDTERLYAREITTEDLDALYEIYSYPEITRYMENLYEDREKEEEFTRNYIKCMYQFYGYGIWVVCLKENDRIIGRAGISNRTIDGELSLEIGYLIDVRYQNQGYASEIVDEILRFAKERLYIDEIRCAVTHENWVSVHLAEKFGFEYEFETGEFIFYKKKLG